MNITLNELLDRTLVVPYDEEIVERLTDVCASYVANKDFNDDNVAELTIMVLSHSSQGTLKSSLEDIYCTKYGESFSIPRSVCETLAMYILLRAIDKNVITYKLALLNTMIIQNEQLERLPHAELFAEVLEKAINAVDTVGELNQSDEAAFVGRLFSASEVSPFSINKDERLAAQRLARKAWYYDMNEYINGDELKGFISYPKVFKALVHIVYSMPWEYYNKEMLKQIRKLTPLRRTKPKTIEEIIKMVRPLYCPEMDIQCDSSVLLQVIANEDHEYSKLPFMKSRLTVRQFAVWLYYELLLEKSI